MSLPPELDSEGVPTLCGWEHELAALRAADAVRPPPPTGLDEVDAVFSCALHMHQPALPREGTSAEFVGNLQLMFERPGEGDNHNAAAFAWCYSRMAGFIEELVAEGAHPRIMLDYSGTLLWGLRQMGRGDVLDALRRVTTVALAPGDGGGGTPAVVGCVEWLGTLWGHAVAPSTPPADLRLHVSAWQHHFCGLFGADALARVRGFSLPEMALPKHPDTLHALVVALREAGYEWVMLQEDTVETLGGARLPRDQCHCPNRLVAVDSGGRRVSITALIKTQGSDTKLVAQNQPYHEARSLVGRRLRLPLLGAPSGGGGGVRSTAIPAAVVQIADGENGGVMMNEFPRDFAAPWRAMRDGAAAGVRGMTGSEYLRAVAAAGATRADFPECQAVGQHALRAALAAAEAAAASEGAAGAAAPLSCSHRDALARACCMEGASWTSNLSWVRGYGGVLDEMQALSAAFHARYDAAVAADPALPRASAAYRRALLLLLLSQTSCFRYWGEGPWTAAARALCARGLLALGGTSPAAV